MKVVLIIITIMMVMIIIHKLVSGLRTYMLAKLITAIITDSR